MLGELQRALEIIYGVSAPGQVADHLVPEPRARLLRPLAAEELLVVERGGELEIGLVLAPDVLARLPELGEGGPRRFLEVLLPSFALAAEGVSHFVYLALQALQDRTVSLLELEVQAEVDKFATGALHLWKHGARGGAGELRTRLFDRVRYRTDLGLEARERYVHANGLGRGYAGYLDARFIRPGLLEGLLAELRALYRLRGAAKLARLASVG